MKLALYAVDSAQFGVLSVWDHPAALAAAELPLDGERVAWWIPDRSEPTSDDANTRLAFIREHGPSPYAFAPSQSYPHLTIDRVWLDDIDVQLLIAQLNADLFHRYPEPGAVVFSLDPADIVDGIGMLLLAEHHGRPVGCGAFRVIEDRPDWAEIKRMYVVPSARGKKIGAAILAELERRATAIGVTRFALETGPRQPEALQLFGRAGYVECEPWGRFVGKSFSVCMARGAG